MLLIAPPAALADNGMTETGVTTYEVVPSQSVITVTLKLSIYNGKPDTVTSTGSTYYYWNATSRVLTVTYSIPAGPHAPGGYRAGSAYLSLCAIGNGYDTGTVSVVVPAGFDLYVDYGSQIDSTGTSG